ncbi:MAG: hypothetical protein PWQ70_1856 [Clostridiales bacterium]|jgi:LacI family transcriptional regulator|nr:hypothetical protein [Clostridiales bacterium]
MDKNKNTTIYDIAKLSNTSIATVSRVLSNTNYPVSQALRKKVLDAAEKLNYTPNLLGRQLKTNQSKDIGVIIPSISNPYYPLLVQGVEDVARKNGYNVLLSNSYRDPKNEEKSINSLFQKQVKGIILASITKNNSYLKSLQQRGLKIVTFDQDVDIECNKINFDYYKGGYLATKHLIDLGHKDIGFISAPLTRYSRQKVYKGFLTCLKEYSIPIKEDFINISETEEESHDEIYEYKNGKALVKRMIEEKNLPTGIICINDMTAFGVIQELFKNKIKVPKDVSVVGFDNIPVSEMISPPLTTIDQCTYEMGSMAAELLINDLEDEKRKEITISLKPTLIVRESTRHI